MRFEKIPNLNLIEKIRLQLIKVSKWYYYESRFSSQYSKLLVANRKQLRFPNSAEQTKCLTVIKSIGKIKIYKYYEITKSSFSS